MTKTTYNKFPVRYRQVEPPVASLLRRRHEPPGGGEVGGDIAPFHGSLRHGEVHDMLATTGI